jgi:UDP-glucose 6-dehydrogenase
VPAKSTVLTQIERRIKQIVSETGSRRLALKVHPEMMEFLREGLMSPLRQLMIRHLVTLRLERLEESTSEAFEIEASKGKK